MTDLAIDFGWIKETFDINGYLYFIGSDKYKLYKLFNSFKIAATSKFLDLTEENYFKTEQFTLAFEGKKLNSKTCKHIFIQTFDDIHKCLFEGKDSLINTLITQIATNKKIQDSLSIIEDQLLTLETMLKKHTDVYLSQVQFISKILRLEEVLKNNFNLAFFDENNEIPSHLQDTLVQLTNFFQLLEVYLKNNGQLCWLYLFQISKYFMPEDTKFLMSKLKELMLNYPHFHVIVIDERIVDFNYTVQDIESIILLNADVTEQMPPFEIVKQTIEDYYPSNRIFSNEELIPLLFKVFPYLGLERECIYLSPRASIILDLLNKVIYGKIIYKYVENELDPLEQAYLESLR